VGELFKDSRWLSEGIRNVGDHGLINGLHFVSYLCVEFTVLLVILGLENRSGIRVNVDTVGFFFGAPFNVVVRDAWLVGENVSFDFIDENLWWIIDN
jgi:hypothetical protein